MPGVYFSWSAQKGFDIVGKDGKSNIKAVKKH